MARSDNATGATRPGVGNRVFFIVVLVVLFALILSAIFVPLGVFRARGEVMVSHGTVTVRRDLYVYWLSAYKYSYLAAAVLCRAREPKEFLQLLKRRSTAGRAA